MAAITSQVWENVNTTGSNIEVVSTQQYLRVSGKTLFRRLIALFSAIALVGSVVAYGTYTSLKHWDQEQAVQRGMDTLRAEILPRAFYDSNGRFPRTFFYVCLMYVMGGSTGAPRCYPGTRVGVLDEIQAWSNCEASDSIDECSPIFWLYTPFPMGKSAIAQTLSEGWYDEGRLAASYMLSTESVNKSESVLVVPTLSYQLHLSFGPHYRAALANTILNDPSILTRSMKTQVDSLIRQPLAYSVAHGSEPFWLRFLRWLFHLQTPSNNENKTRIIVIDGLDSVLDNTQQRELLESLGSLIMDGRFKLRLFVSSQPSAPIQGTFDSAPNFNVSTTRLKLVNDQNMTDDIEHFVRSEFGRIRRERGIANDWPSEDTVKGMVKRFRGQFPVADYTMSCIGSPNCNPRYVLDNCLVAVPAIPHPAPEYGGYDYSTYYPPLQDPVPTLIQ